MRRYLLDVRITLAVACVVLGLGAGVRAQVALGTAFTYQGRLTDAGAPATGSYDLQFKLFDAVTAGGQVGGTVTAANTAVAAGVFTVSLDFGASAFGGSARWLVVGVRPGGSSGAFTLLTPRQALTPSPHALYSVNASSSTTAAAAATATQLNGQPASFYLTLANQTGTLSVAQGGTGATSVAASPFQSRVTGVCLPGSVLLSVNTDGTVVCQSIAQPPRAGVTLTTVDSLTQAGAVSITIGADGLGLIGYYDSLNQTLKVAHCNNPTCGGATSATLGPSGGSTSITIGADGLGLIVHTDTLGHLRTAHCANAACDSVTSATVDNVSSAFYPSITIGADGLGLISYYDNNAGHLRAAHCTTVACGTAALVTVDLSAGVGQYTSIATGTDGFGLISYYDQSNADLKVAHCLDAGCSSAGLTAADSTGAVGSFTSITIGADGLGLTSYYDATNAHLKVAHCTTVACGAVTAATIDATFQVGQSTSITVGSDGLGLISYYDQSAGKLKVAHCGNAACSSATVAALDNTSSGTPTSAITLGADGFGLIVYLEPFTSHVRVAHCGNTACTPFVVGRR